MPNDSDGLERSFRSTCDSAQGLLEKNARKTNIVWIGVTEQDLVQYMMNYESLEQELALYQDLEDQYGGGRTNYYVWLATLSVLDPEEVKQLSSVTAEERLRTGDIAFVSGRHRDGRRMSKSWKIERTGLRVPVIGKHARLTETDFQGANAYSPLDSALLGIPLPQQPDP